MQTNYASLYSGKFPETWKDGYVLNARKGDKSFDCFIDLERLMIQHGMVVYSLNFRKLVSRDG